MHPAVLDGWTAAAREFEKLGARIVPARLPDWYFGLAREVGMIIASEAFELHRAHIEDPAQPINDAVRARILGAKQLAPGEYAGMLRQMAARRQAFAEWFRGYDAILLPTAPLPAPPVDEIDEMAPVPSYLTRSANYLGLCALALPSGFHEGLPLSVQVIGKPFAERDVLEIGHAFQQATGHHRRRPALA